MNNIFNFRARQLIPLSALSLLILSHAATASMIDDFSTDQGASCASTNSSRLCVTGANDSSSPHQLASFVNGTMLTGERDIYIQSNSADSGDSSVRVVDGSFDWTNSSKASSTVVIQWDGSDGADSDIAENSTIQDAPTESFNQLLADRVTDDYTFGGRSNGLVFDVSNNDTGFTYQLLLTDIEGNTATFDGVSTGAEKLISFNYSDFLLKDSDEKELASGFDFTQVDNFQLTLTSSEQGNSVNFNIDYIAAAIAEPSHMALFAMGLFGTSALSRRKQDQPKR